MAHSNKNLSRPGAKSLARPAALLAALVLAPAVVFAHTALIRSAPKANSKSQKPPKLVELWFNEELEPNLNTVEVTDAQGQRVDRGEVTLAEGNKKAQVELNDLAPGTYVVNWKAVSEDEHTVRGKFTFTVEAPAGGAAAAVVTPTPAQATAPQGPATPAPVAAAPDSSPQAASPAAAPADEISWAQTAVRWLTYLAMMALFGGFAFRLFVLAPAMRRTAPGGAEGREAVSAGDRRALSLSWASLFLLVLTTLAALVMQASSVYDRPVGEALSPALLGRVLTETGYGGAWLLQAASAVVITVILFLLRGRVRRGDTGEHSALWWAGLAASAALLVAPSWTGHAAVAARHFPLSRFSDWLHLLAGGFWVGGLFHLALTWPRALAPLDESQRARSLHQVIRLFTRVAVPSVALLVLAGLYNTWTHVPRVEALWMTPYGEALALKLILVALMLALGGLHNFYYGKKAAALEPSAGDAYGHDGAGLERGFSRTLLVEAGLGVLVLLVTAVLVFMTPARNHPAMDRLNMGAGVTQEQR